MESTGRIRLLWKYPPGTLCSVEDCDRLAVAKTWCKPHYYKAKDHDGDPLAGYEYRRSIKFFNRSMLIKTDECMLWPYKKRTGYGVVNGEGAHVRACRQRYGPMPSPGMQAAHKCRNRHCFNPRHVSWKTKSGNQLDKIRDQTMNQGETSHWSVLTSEDVIQIRQAWEAGDTTQHALALQYGVTPSNISAIIRRKSWKFLT